MKPIVLASDHGGFELKEVIKEHLMYKDFRVEDIGCFNEESVDYPDMARKGCLSIKKHNTYGIFVCGSGIGICIAANKVAGIRAALCHSEVYAQLARQHNDANVLCLGGRFLDVELALRMVDIFLETQFLGGRHKKRVDMMG